MKKILNVLMLTLCAISPLALRGDQEVTEEQRVEQKISFAGTTHHGSNHIYMGVTYYADQLEIEDGSFWLIRPDQRWMTLDWIPGDVLLITQASWWSKHHHGYEFSFYNIRTGDTIDVEASVGPVFGSFYRRSIISLDFCYGYASVMLDDGSIWQLPESDRYTWERWYIGDSIIIGTNGDTFGAWVNPNLLINLTCSQTYFATKCLN